MTNFPSDSPLHVWAGRDDGPGIEHARWHSEISPLKDIPGVVLLGFASDEGVRRNNGRVGARKGPDAIRKALSSMAVHSDIRLYDAGNIRVIEEDLETGQDALSSLVATLLGQDHLIIVLGGGHETAFGTHRGFLEVSDSASTIINLDAHFDLRDAELASSGTPFKQIAALRGEDFSYSVLGISPSNNTRALFSTAQDLNVHVTTDEELAQLTPSQAADLAVYLINDYQNVHLSIDLDVLPASVAPGVSAPATLGVSLAHIMAIVRGLVATGKVKLIDVVELNPDLDRDEQTARVAARLINEIVITHQS